MTPSKRGRGYAQGRRKHNTNYVYGAKSTAAKTRYVMISMTHGQEICFYMQFLPNFLD